MLVEKKKKRSSEIPTASLADIAFLLLIFFLVTTTIDVDRGIGLTLPPKGETTEVRKKNILNLLVNARERWRSTTSRSSCRNSRTPSAKNCARTIS